MKILAIDTSCDETSVAIADDLKILANIIASQVDLHKKWGGIVPDIARRAHNENIGLSIQEAFARASITGGQKITIEDIDVIAATYGPGLAIALEVGLKKAQELANKHDKKFVAINHMEGHMLSPLTQNSVGSANIYVEDLKYPVLGILISGKHTELVNMTRIGKYKILGDTLDDAIGEAFDKVARMVDLGYPGGAALAELANQGDDSAFDFPIPLKGDPRIAFSYSGLKTAVYYTVKTLKEEQGSLTKKQVLDICASFQRAAVEHLCQKIEQVVKENKFQSIFIGGGVTANLHARSRLRHIAMENGLEIYFPPSNKLNTDNAAMIATAAYFNVIGGNEFSLQVDREPRASLSSVAY